MSHYQFPFKLNDWTEYCDSKLPTKDISPIPRNTNYKTSMKQQNKQQTHGLHKIGNKEN